MQVKLRLSLSKKICICVLRNYFVTVILYKIIRCVNKIADKTNIHNRPNHVDVRKIHVTMRPSTLSKTHTE